MKKSKIILFIFEIIIIAASLFISIGIYLNNISKPKYIFSKGINFVGSKIDNYSKLSNDLYLNDKYSIKGNVEFDLDSDYYKKTNDSEEKKTYNLISNLNNMDTSFKIQKNKSKKIGYIEIDESIENENILNAKYYINDSTKYYYIKDVVDDYINDGSCNYFENINSSTTERDNLNYLQSIVIDSIINNLKEEYFTTKEEKDTYVVTLKIDNDNIKDILKGVLKDLKNDEKSKRILNNIDKNILKTKIKKTYLKKEEYYEISIYTSKILHRPLKYKVESVKNDSINTYIYKGNDKKGSFEYLVNDTLKYDIDLEFKKDDIKAVIKNSSNKKIGEFKLEKNNYNTTINYIINNDNKRMDLIYSSKFSKVKKNESYINKKNLSFKYVVDKETKLNGEVDIVLNVSNKVSILTDISNAKLKMNITNEEKEKIDNLYRDIKSRLER